MPAHPHPILWQGALPAGVACFQGIWPDARAAVQAVILRLATVDPAACDCEAMFDTAQRCEVDAGINKTSAWVEFLKHCKDEPLTEGEKEKIESAMHEAGEPLLNNAELAVSTAWTLRSWPPSATLSSP